VKALARRRAARGGAVIALIVIAEFGYAGSVIGVAASAGIGLTSTVTVSIDGGTGTWAPVLAESSAAAPATTGTTAPDLTAPPDSPPEQPIAPTTPSVPEATPPRPPSAGTTPADEPSRSGEPEPVTP
jgi:hypothetical protein